MRSCRGLRAAIHDLDDQLVPAKPASLRDLPCRPPKLAASVTVAEKEGVRQHFPATYQVDLTAQPSAVQPAHSIFVEPCGLVLGGLEQGCSRLT